MRIENCSFIDNGRPANSYSQALTFEGPLGGPTYVYNCSFVDHTNGTAVTIAEVTADSTLELYNNLFYNNSVLYKDIGPGVTNNVNTITALNALPEAKGNVTGDPLFLDKANLDLRFPKSSPCVDAGTNVLGFAPSSDYYDNPRPVDRVGIGAEGSGSGYDIGIYELPLPLRPGTVMIVL